MKSLKTALLFFMAIVISCTMLPIRHTNALLRSIDMSRVNRYASRKLLLTIGDMKFDGKLGNATLTDKELEKLIEEALEKMGMSEKDFDALNNKANTFDKNQTLTKADYERLKNNFFDIAGSTPVGPITSAIQILEQILSGKYGDASGSIAEMLTDSSGYGIDVLGKIWSWFKSLSVPANEWMRDQKKMREMIEGLNANRKLDEFYNALDSAIEDFLRRNKGGLAVQFNGAEDTKPFTLFGVQYPETWTLDMTLFKVSDSATDSNLLSGKYEGKFTINIKYDLSDIPSNMKQIGNPGRTWGEATDPLLDAPAALNLLSAGTNSVKRRLEGKATVEIDIDSGKATIQMTMETDEKDVTLSGIMVGLDGVMTKENMRVTYDCEYEIHGDENSISIDLTKNHVETNTPNGTYSSDGAGVGLGEKVPWDKAGDIWERGDNFMIINKSLQLLPASGR